MAEGIYFRVHLADEEQRKEMEKWLDITKDIHVKVIKVWVYGMDCR